MDNKLNLNQKLVDIHFKLHNTEFYVGLLTLFKNLGYVIEHEEIRDDEDTIARLRIERKPISNGNNDTNY